MHPVLAATDEVKIFVLAAVFLALVTPLIEATTLVEGPLKCALCGSTSQQEVLYSSNTLFGSADLDGRPAEMLRSTMRAWVHECPSCGYCSYNLEEKIDGAKDTTKSASYVQTLADKNVDELVRRFLCLAQILDAAGDKKAALENTIHASWAADDAGDKAKAYEIRRRILEKLDDLTTSGDKFWDEVAGDHLLASEVFRRIGDFKKAVDYAIAGLQLDPEIEVQKALRYELALIAQGDTKSHQVVEALEEEADELDAGKLSKIINLLERPRKWIEDWHSFQRTWSDVTIAVAVDDVHSATRILDSMPASEIVGKIRKRCLRYQFVLQRYVSGVQEAFTKTDKDDEGLYPGAYLGILNVEKKTDLTDNSQKIAVAVTARRDEQIDSRELVVGVTFFKSVDGEKFGAGGGNISFDTEAKSWVAFPEDSISCVSEPILLNNTEVEIFEARFDQSSLKQSETLIGCSVKLYYRGYLQDAHLESPDFWENTPEASDAYDYSKHDFEP